ncbi:ATP-binding protein [Methyloterricola oryzae]|uniref:ATP-binding protein n=1 Tax=Methyloterricola oryzae TaxID=1495050 RepID=UPI0005EBA4A8|nr:ATP-binding protein [Methyloterricola oryzae]
MSAADWYAENHAHLLQALGKVRALLEHQVAKTEGEKTEDPAPEPESVRDSQAETPERPFALDALCASFGLSPFERHLLLLCAGVEFESAPSSLCARAQGDPQRTYPTFSLALATLPEAHWSALTPDRPLRRWRLIEVGPGNALTASPLRIDERVLHYLAGVNEIDNRLAGWVQTMEPPDDLAPCHLDIARQLATQWSNHQEGRLPIAWMRGGEPADNRAIAAAACAFLGLELQAMPVNLLPTGPSELENLLRLWEREALLRNSALLLEEDEDTAPDSGRAQLVSWFAERVLGGIILTGGMKRLPAGRAVIHVDVRKPDSTEQLGLWQQALGVHAEKLNGSLERLTGQFDLGAPAVQAACSEALAQATQPEELPERLWQACRVQARSRLDQHGGEMALAQRIESAATWDDLVLPEAQKQILREIAVHVRQRFKVYETWGFGRKSSRGLGISTLFAGASGTGKTLAAEVLANELGLDLYRIDLSSVVSKYIGETEKNLRRVFDAAESGGAILLFDEADALFGKRSEVKDSHDRHANVEVSYLLQRMEAYRGLAVLTTNLKDALDTAFLRRIRFVVQFPFPDAAQRAEIWQRMFPSTLPTEGLNLAQLSRLNVSGGNIRNIALNAAFHAAEKGEALGMFHLLEGAHGEYAKLEKSLSDNEIEGWL